MKSTFRHPSAFDGWRVRGRPGGGAAPEPTARVLVVDGDSFVARVGGQLAGRFAVGHGRGVVAVTGVASGGKTYHYMNANGAADVDALFDDTPGAANVLLHGGGWINSCVLGGYSIAQTDVQALAYFADRDAAGWWVMLFPNQVTAYDEAVLAEAGGDANLLARLLAWEGDDPSYSANSRWHADRLVDLSPASYRHQTLDWRDGGYWADKWYTRLSYSRNPEYLGDSDQSTSGGRSHPTRYGEGRKCDFAFASLCSKLVLAAPTSLADDLWAYWPMWSGDPNQGANPVCLDYWRSGVNTLYRTGGTQNAGSVTLAANVFNDYLQTSASAATVAHTLHARAGGWSLSGWVTPNTLAAAPGGNEQVVVTVDGEYRLFFDSTAGVVKWRTWRSSGGTTDEVASAVTLANGTPCFITAGYDGSAIQVSVNNETPVTLSVPSVYGGSSNEFTVAYTGPAWRGLSANYQGWEYRRRVLTAGERASRYNGGTPKATLFGSA